MKLYYNAEGKVVGTVPRSEVPEGLAIIPVTYDVGYFTAERKVMTDTFVMNEASNVPEDVRQIIIDRAVVFLTEGTPAWFRNGVREQM